jgi:hypothetical protein
MSTLDPPPSDFEFLNVTGAAGEAQTTADVALAWSTFARDHMGRLRRDWMLASVCLRASDYDGLGKVLEPYARVEVAGEVGLTRLLAIQQTQRLTAG